jgi:DME family drug/metabolite transporter
LTGVATTRTILPMAVHAARQRRAVLEILGAAVLFGTTGTTASFAPPGATSISIGSARLVIGGAGLFVALPRLGGSRRGAVGRWRNPWGFTAGVMTALYQLAFFAGVSRAGVALATLVTIGSGPILVGFLSWLLLRERPTSRWWASTGTCIVGLALLTFSGSEQPGVHVGGLVFSLAAGLSYAAYTVAAKRLLIGGYAAPEVMASAFSLGGLILLPVLLVSGGAWIGSARGLAVTLWLGLGTTSVAYALFGRGLQVLPAGPTATLGLAEPLVATLLGLLVLGEHLGLAGWVGATLVAVGLGLQGLVSVRPGRGPHEGGRLDERPLP